MDLRQYDPAIGRWVVQDPIVHHDFSPYSAFDNNPVYWSDPSGANSVRYNWDTGNYDVFGKNDDLLGSFDPEQFGNYLNNPEAFAAKFYEFSDFDENNGNGGGNGNGKGGGNGKGNNRTIQKEKENVANIIELIVGEDAIQIHLDALEYSTRLDGSINWAGYSAYSWQQIKFNDFSASYGSLSSYRTQSKSIKAFSYTKTAAKHLSEIVKKGANKGQLARPYMHSTLTIRTIMSTGKGLKDATYPGGINYNVPGVFRGSEGIWQLGLNPITNVIYHFNFVSKK